MLNLRKNKRPINKALSSLEIVVIPAIQDISDEESLFWFGGLPGDAVVVVFADKESEND